MNTKYIILFGSLLITFIISVAIILTPKQENIDFPVTDNLENQLITPEIEDKVEEKVENIIDEIPPEPTQIIMSIEGDEEIIDALRYTKDGYSIAIPIGEYVESDVDKWTAVVNSDVTFEVIRHPSDDITLVAETLGEIYSTTKWFTKPTCTILENNTVLTLQSIGAGSTTYYYVLISVPSMEYMEGFGTRIGYIINSLDLD
ncbi:MAG: hypothetical protein R3Y12_01410 [Clostridia bacterium]